MFNTHLKLGPVLNAENINADTPKILTPTHFSDPKDINAKKWVVGVVPWNFFFQSELSALIFGALVLRGIRPKTIRPTKWHKPNKTTVQWSNRKKTKKLHTIHHKNCLHWQKNIIQKKLFNIHQTYARLL